MQIDCLLLPITLLFSFLFFSGTNLQSANPRDISIDWTHYHNYAKTTELLKDFTNKYERLCKLYSIGKSFQGKEIWCMEVTNYASEAPQTKPGMYNDGRINEHAPGNARAATNRNYPAYWASDMLILKC